MKKDAIIKIISTQRDGEGGSESAEMTVTGTVTHNGSESVIEYTEESEDAVAERTSVTVTDGKTVSIVREGEFSSEMSVERNRRHHTFYKTPYGEFTMGIYGNSVTWFRNGRKSVLKMKYTLDFNNGYISENSMNIYIEEK